MHATIHAHNLSNMVAERRSDTARLARRIADVLVPPIMEEIVKVVKTVFQEQIVVQWNRFSMIPCRR